MFGRGGGGGGMLGEGKERGYVATGNQDSMWHVCESVHHLLHRCSLQIKPSLIRSRYYVRNAKTEGANERRLYSQAIHRLYNKLTNDLKLVVSNWHT